MGFEMTVSLPRDPRYVATARLIAALSAKEAGCAGAPAETFAGNVEDVARTCLSASIANPHATMAVTREPDALVVTIDQHVMRLTL
jgi:hypothetical protein